MQFFQTDPARLTIAADRRHATTQLDDLSHRIIGADI
jgi:hypothetical protein